MIVCSHSSATKTSVRSGLSGGERQRLFVALALWLGQTDDPTALWWPFLIAAVAGVAAVRVARRRAI